MRAQCCYHIVISLVPKLCPESSSSHGPVAHSPSDMFGRGRSGKILRPVLRVPDTKFKSRYAGAASACSAGAAPFLGCCVGRSQVSSGAPISIYLTHTACGQAIHVTKCIVMGQKKCSPAGSAARPPPSCSRSCHPPAPGSLESWAHRQHVSLPHEPWGNVVPGLPCLPAASLPPADDVGSRCKLPAGYHD